jgi:rhodanese-related sulfurtransferase
MFHDENLKPGVANDEELQSLAGVPLIIDVRDANEVEAGKGGPPHSLPNSIHVPLNINDAGQSVRTTTAEEFSAKLVAAGIDVKSLDKETSIITHCGGGGRGGKAAKILLDLGFVNVKNGGGPKHIARSLGLK